MKRLLNLILISCLCQLAARASLTQEGSKSVLAVSDGKGSISLLWVPAAAQWNFNGWQISDSTGRVLVPKVAHADPAALEPLSIEDADAIKRLPQAYAKAQGQTQQKQVYGILVLRALSDPAYARALGISCTLTNLPPGSRSYTVTALDANGKPTAYSLRSQPIDSSIASPLPPMPDAVHAETTMKGVALGWSAPASNDSATPIIAYTIERDSTSQSGTPVNAKPVVPGTSWDAKIPLFLDSSAPGNQQLTYHVYAIDAFGRRSRPANLHFFHLDVTAMEPPHPVVAEAAPGKITISWPKRDNPNFAGYLVERAHLFDGPYEALHTQALPPESTEFVDENTQPGTLYYYRVRAVDSRGDLGLPSKPASAVSRSLAPPPTVQGLTATLGQTRVRLTWNPVAAVAGYFVERHVTTGNSPNNAWVRLNSHLATEPLYDDPIGNASATTMQYRIVAVSFDSVESQPCTAVSVTLPDTAVPDPPSITAASGANGKALINFVPAPPTDKIASFLILRSGMENDLGVVIGDPLPATAHNFTDLYVKPGEHYFYRIVTVAKNGYRSDPTQPVIVRIGAPQIAAPATPTATFAAAPFAHVTLTFAGPTNGLAVIVERQTAGNGPWLRIAGPTGGTTATDFNPQPGAQLSYRITYQASDGTLGSPSTPVQVAIPNSK